MLRLDECVGRAGAGGKAERLAEVRRAGLPALDGVVLLPGDAVEAMPFLGPYIVRSSSTLEDRPGASGAGVYLSLPDVSVEELPEAVARVRASADDEPARAYLLARNLEPRPIAVLVQPMVKAERLGVAMSGYRVEERRAGEPEWGDVEARPVDEPLGRILNALEALLHGPVDVEYAVNDKNITILQVRPRAAGPLEALEAQWTRFAEPGRWKLDAEHNPRPLSSAQAGLVALAEALEVGARQRVVGGYLYAQPAPRNLHPLPLADLRRRFDEEVAPDCRARMAEAHDLESALTAYQHVYRRYVGEVASAVARARTQLDQLLRMNLHEPLSLHGELLAGTGGAALRRDQMLWQRDLDAYLKVFGAWSPAWDVAVPSDDEAPERVRRVMESMTAEPNARHAEAVARAEAAASALLDRLDRMARRAFKALLPTVRAAVEVGEDDDALFFEAQRMVRRALFALALPLEDPNDVFDLPLESIRQKSGDWQRLAADGRAARLAAERTVPPLEIVDGVPQRPLPAATEVLRGHATSGRARGRALVVKDPAQAPANASDRVLVVPAMLPSLAYLLPGARALVTAHGGATSHGATLAREYGLPAVLGARGADQIADGTELFVDGGAGRVYLL